MEYGKNNTQLAPRKSSNKNEKGLPKYDDSYTEQLIINNTGIVRYLARKYNFSMLEFDDIVSVGSIGLVKAARTYDKNRNIKFVTYAAKCINNEILMHFRYCKRSWNNIAYLDEPIANDFNGNILTLSDILPDTSTEYESRIINRITLAESLQRIFNSLDIKSLIIFLADAADLPQEHCAMKLNITQSHVSRIARNTKANLTKCIKTNGEWEISYGNDSLHFSRADEVTARFSLDDKLWDNLTTWLFKISSIPKPRHNTTLAKRGQSKTIKFELFRSERAKKFGVYIVEHKATVRGTAKHFDVSKTTVHNEIMNTLPKVSQDLFKEVQEILAQNKSERNLRGGSANKHKCMKMRQETLLMEFQYIMTERFGCDGYKVTDERVYIWQPEQGWQFYASGLEEAKILATQEIPFC